MRQLQLERVKNAAVIVAHPDDETIWMGGTIARYRDVRWTIFSLCRRSDSDRMPKFMRVAKYYGARGIICDVEDEGVMNAQEGIPVMKKTIKTKLPRKTWDVLFTHGSNGEYGHARHRGTHRAVVRMLGAKELKAREVFFFAYRFDKEKKIAIPRKNAAYFVELSNAEWQAKRNVIKQLYGFRSHIFENRSCAKTETFVK